MATITAPARHLSLTVVLIAALFIGAMTTIWLSTDNNAGTNSLATDGR